MIKESFAIRLRELRLSSSLTQHELALKVGLTQRKISKLETKQLSPSPQAIIDIAQFFCVSTDYLLGIDK